MTDLRQSANWARFLTASGWQVAGSPGTFAFIRRIPLAPIAVIKIQRPTRLNFATTNQLAKKHRAFWVYIEPATAIQVPSLHRHGFKLSKSPFLPAKTIHLNLIPPLPKILEQMKKDGRYSVRRAEKYSLQLIKAPDLTTFYTAWPRRRGWKPSLKNLQTLKAAFGKNVLFLAAANTDSGQILAGTVILLTNRVAYYYYAFTAKQGRQKLAQYWLVWQAIKEAKKQNCQIFDFEGIFDPRFSSHSWIGFSHFKRSFGGKEITYPGCFVKRGFFWKLSPGFT